ncbi:unnamed protein product [Mytilus coruscus]|uniref:Integrase catalytic domain-containing protein n=1 Tax=Mytilus coruscus TaxID=42192 RepID=A0A6J8AQ12_MYTCO|nr:unnamed protein product [Mytilus coruscus]
MSEDIDKDFDNILARGVIEPSEGTWSSGNAKYLHKLTEKGREYLWTKESKNAFETLKSKLLGVPILSHSDFSKPLILDTNTSQSVIGAVLSLETDGKEKKYRLREPYTLEDRAHTLRLLERNAEGQLARWLEVLSSYNLKIIKHRHGHQHRKADALSRTPCKQSCYKSDWKKNQPVNIVTQAPIFEGNEDVKSVRGKRKRAQMQIQKSGYPIERIAIDNLGKLPKTARNDKYILVIGDYNTKLTESFPMENMGASTVAYILATEIIYRCGVPTIHSDHRRQFESETFSESVTFSKLAKPVQHHTIHNPMVWFERFNSMLLNMLSVYNDKHHTN